MKAHIRPHNGAPTLFLDGQPVYANLQWCGGLDLSNPQRMAITQQTMREFAKAGGHLVRAAPRQPLAV